jgi:hypothetical protein
MVAQEIKDFHFPFLQVKPEKRAYNPTEHKRMEIVDHEWYKG